MRLLVSGAGATTGLALVRALRSRGVWVVAADPSPYAPGRQLGCESVTAPWSSDDAGLFAFYEEQASRVDGAALHLSGDIPVARAAGMHVWACSDEAVSVCEDKWAFADQMQAAGIMHPDTLDTAPTVDGDWVVKPRFGEGSRHTFRVQRAATVAALMDELGDSEELLVQSALTGTEWEVDVMADDGRLAGGVAFWKHRMKAGTTVAAETFNIDVLDGVLREVVSRLGLNGPLNIGGFFDPVHGPSVLEVNPRWSHGFLIAEAAGGNPIEYFLRMMDGEAAPDSLLECRAGIRFDRYWTHTVTEAVPRHVPTVGR